MENVIRKDIIQISFDVNDSGLVKANKEVENFRKSVTGGVNSGVEKLKKGFDGLKKTTEGLGKNSGIDKLKKSIEQGGNAIDNAKKKAESLKNTLTEGEKGAAGFKNALANIGKASVSKVTSGFEKIKDSITKSTTHSKNFSSRLKEIGNASVSKLSNGLQKIKSQLSDIAKKAAGAAFNGVKKLAGISFKAFAAGVGAAATAIGVIAKQAVEAYGNAEQLIGGVETLFGAGGAKSVQEYAKNVGKSVKEVQSKYDTLKKAESIVIKNSNDAYKTAGLSANDYMETVTSFSSSLIQSLNGDTLKAANVANRAIIDMSDNANKMGTDMGLIQNAYQGFAKQNYTIKSNSRAA